MKGLSIEEKAKAYDEALKKAKDMLSYKEVRQEDIEYIFPELKESEDERIMGAFRDFAENYLFWGKSGLTKEKALAWLEKQGEQKPVDSTLEIKPKFKVGDTIKELETGNLFYVNSVEDFGYTLHYKNCNANGCTMSFKYEDKYELAERKPAWSEEEIENCAREAEDNNCIILAKHIRQLKSLRPQSTWKPSDNELEVLRLAAEKDGACLMGLYEQLKKLREE